jgi:hypothetical protein
MLGFPKNLSRSTTLIVRFNITLLLTVILMSLSLSLVALIALSILEILSTLLLSPSSAIVTKISRFSTQSITASLIYLIVLISY